MEEHPNQNTKERPRLRLKNGLWAVAILVLAGLLAAFLYATGFFDSVRSLDDMRAYIERFNPYSYIIYFLVQFASIIIAPIPSNVTSLAGAALFGTLPAFLLTYAAVLLGSAVVFQLARMLGRPFVERFVSRGNMEKYMGLIQRKQDIFFIMAFLLPGFPDDILCFLAGLTQLPFRRFLFMVAAFRPWGLLVSCAVGGNALSLPLWALALLCAAGVAVFLAAMKYGDRWEDAVLKKLDRDRR